MLRNMIVTAVTTGIETSTNESQFAVQQIEYMGKTTDCLVFFPYGQFARLPKEQFLLLFSIGGEENHRATFGSGNPVDRPEIDQGEVVYFHPQTKTKLTFKNNGDLDIDSQSNLNITVNGDINLTPNGRVNLGSGGGNIVRDTDNLSVNITFGSSTGIFPVSINSSGNNTST